MESEALPAYLRLRACIAAMILRGNYRDGDMLPSLRALAAEQGANPLTVAKAYQSFLDEEIVVVKRGVGMFLAEGATERLRTSERERFLTCYWPRIRDMIDRLGLDPAALLAPSESSETPVAA